MMRRFTVTLICALAVLVACGDTRHVDPPARAGPDRSATDVALDSAAGPAGAQGANAAPPREAPRPGVRFDPSTLRRGETVGELVADSVVAQRTIVDSTWVGMARFDGRIELSGWTFRHPDADLGEVEICFEVDPQSAARLPRWEGDERRPWFCFENRTDARQGLGPPSSGNPATIVIERFTIYRGFSDEVNSARFVR